MRPISARLAAKLNSNEKMQLKQKLLLYRRKWNGNTFIIESTPFDISDAITQKGTNATINQQLDTQQANIWRVGNLTLTLYNKDNRFWEGKETGLFPAPYTIYGSKLEYYVGDEIEYVRVFTGYLTVLPTYRQDDALVEFQVVNRLDYLKTVSAEGVSTTRTKQQLTKIDNRNFRTPNNAVGRVQAVYKGTSAATAILMQEKTEYSVSSLNKADAGALITLTSDIESGYTIYATYLYWRQGIMINDAVNQLLDVANITDRYVEPVIFQNAVRVYNPNPLADKWMWLCRPTAVDAFAPWYADTVSSNDYWWWDRGNLTGVGRWGCNMSYGTIRFQVSRNENTQTSNNVVYIAVGNGTSGQEFVLTMGGVGGNGKNRQLSVNFKGTGATALGSYGNEDIFYLSWNASTIRLYKNSSQIWSATSDGFFASQFRIVSGVGYMKAELRNLAAKPSTNPFDTTPFYDYQTCIFTVRNTTQDIRFDRMMASVAGSGSPVISQQVRYRNGSGEWTGRVNYVLGTALSVNFNTVEFLITNTAGFGNNATWSMIRLWSFQTKNIPLGVVNFTNMDVLKALQELAGMAMYEIGFDSNDQFFFRKRQRSSALREFKDDKILGMPSIKADIDRMVTRVVVTFGEYTRIVDADTQEIDENGNTIHPNNKDKYGERSFELGGSQLIPASNVDLTYAVATTIYEELSKLRLEIALDVMYDLELELGDYVRILHNNNLWSKLGFTDFTKWKELGTFYMRCKVEGIKSNFNKRTTSLVLTDFSTPEDMPQEQFEAFMYMLMGSFGAKRL